MTVIVSLRRRERQTRAAKLTLVGIATVLATLVAGPAAAAKSELRPVKGAITAGDFVALDLAGRAVKFSVLRGDAQDAPAWFGEANAVPPRARGRAGAAKVVLLNFWATWCPPCRREMPAMEQLYQAYRDRGLVVLAVSQDQAPLTTVRRFAEELRLGFPVWHDRDGLVGRQYSIPGVPASYLIGVDGRIAYRVLGEYDWFGPEARATVERLLAARER